MIFPIIEVENLCKFYEDHEILKNINFKIFSGETLAIIGPSGSGKSTILKILSGLEEQDKGNFKLRKEKIGMAFQYSALLNSYTVSENVAFALHDRAITQKEKENIVHEKLEMVGMKDYANYMPYELSGGQQKRVSFARAIANDPEIIFYDEPTAGLDPINSTIIEDYINKLSKNSNCTSIVVTHQYSTIKRTANKIICLFKGKIVWEGNKENLETDDNEYIRQFMDAKIKGPFTESTN